MPYAEWRVAADVEVWRGSGSRGSTRILPDGCLDLLWMDDRLQVAGPDSAARLHDESGSTTWGVRLHGGRGAALLGVPADHVADQTVPLDALWSERATRSLTRRVAEDPGRELAAWATTTEADPFGMRLRSLLAGGASVEQAAAALGFSTRQLQRRTTAAFGYGPRHLGRVLRLVRAVAAADAGQGWAQVASSTGYTDQAHLARQIRALTGTTPTALRRERVRSVQDVA